MAKFDDSAKAYDEWYNSKLGKFVDKVEDDCAFGLFTVKKGMTVLDIGCGTGNYSIKLAKMGYKVIGIDVSDEMLNIAKEKAKDKGLDIGFYKKDVLNLDFEDEQFDAVFSMAALEFIPETKKAIDNIFKVVKKGGKILIGTINRESKWGELYLSKEFQENSVFKYAKLKTTEELKQLKSENLVNIKECLYIPPNVNEDDISLEKELELSKSERGGFVCTLWEK